MRHYLFALVLVGAACKSQGVPSDTGGATTAAGGTTSGGGATSGGGGDTGGTAAGADGGQGGLPAPMPRLHPPPGFESCIHAEVTADCADGWCRLPPSCFVMGAPEGEWFRGQDSQQQTPVTLTHHIEIQQREFTRDQWQEHTGLQPRGPDSCTDPACPVSMVSWWDAVHAANLLSEQKDLEPCYEPVGCTGSLGQDLSCTGVADPEKSVYECEGYRLPTRAEAEYAARAGTWSTFYSGDITEYDDSASCLIDPALEKIAWYCFNSGNRAHIGGELEANGFGLHDMIGNLGEWTNEEAHYSSSPGGEDPRGNIETNPNRLRFSPQYDDKSWVLRTAALLSGSWSARTYSTGFRLVRTLPD